MHPFFFVPRQVWIQLRQIKIPIRSKKNLVGGVWEDIFGLLKNSAKQ